jgi:hypothetical protein
MTGQVTLEGFPGRSAYVFPIKRLHKLYIIYAVYRSNATGQVDKKLLFTILVLEQLRAARDKKMVPSSPTPNRPCLKHYETYNIQPIGPDYSPASIQATCSLSCICCTVK